MTHTKALPTPPLDILGIPEALPGSPTLARHLAWALGHIAKRCPLDSDLTSFDEARQALEALPLVSPAVRTLNGIDYMEDEDGRLTPLSLVKPHKLLEDDFVRTVARGALALNASLARFGVLSFSEGQSLLEVLAAAHGVKLGGRKGNVSIRSFDGAYCVEISNQDRITFGPGVEIAKQLLFEWINEENASEELKAIVSQAFQLDDQKRLRASEVKRLEKYRVPNAKWIKAMEVLSEAIEVTGTKEYLRVYRRDSRGQYQLIPLDLANAGRAAA